MRKKLIALSFALAAAAVASGLFQPQPAEAACKRICCPDGPCITCCQAPCPTIVCPP